MRIAHTADLHLGHERFGTASEPRLDDYAHTVARFVEAAAGADVAVLAGDTFHDRRPGPAALAALTGALHDLTEAGAQVVVLPGNHDGPTTIGDAASNSLRWLRDLRAPGVHVPVHPSTWTIATRSGPLTVSAMPYPHRRALDLEMPDAAPEERTEQVSRKAEAIIEGLGADVPRGQPHLFVGHLSVVGGRVGAERAMRFGWDVTVRAEVLDRFDYAALGHLHPQQRVSARAWYAGAPDYHDFGEMGQPKGFLVAELRAGGDPDVQPVPSGARPIGILELVQRDERWVAEGREDLGPPEWYAAGPILRARLHASERAPGADSKAALRRRLLELGAHYVETEEVLEGAAAPARRARLAPDDDAGGELDPPAMLRRWLELTDRPLEPALSVGTAMIAAQAAGGGPE